MWKTTINVEKKQKKYTINVEMCGKLYKHNKNKVKKITFFVENLLI